MEETTPSTAKENTSSAVADAPPRIAQAHTPDGPCTQVLGHWTAARLAEPADWARVAAELKAASPATPEWDLRDVQRLDHTGAQLLWNTWGRQWPQTLHALPGQRAMLSA